MTSLWAERTPRPDGIAKTLDGDVSVDVLVIGGGMAGMLCAYLLGRAGCSCAVAEQGRVGSGVTQNTTAKVTAQHNLVYDRLMREHGVENARLYYEANQAAVAGLRQLSDAFPCDFEEKTAYVYAEDSTEGLERELAAYEQLGIPHHVLPSAPVPIANKGALGMERQAQFNPLKRRSTCTRTPSSRRCREPRRARKGAPSLPSTSCSRPITPWSTSRDSIS